MRYLILLILVSNSFVLAGEKPLLIEGVSVFDPSRKEFIPDQSVLTNGDRISAVSPASEIGDLPPDLVRIDGRGKYLIPGLIDAHVHVVHILDFAHMTGDEVLPLYLAAGVTGIRSTGDEIVAATIVARTAASRPESSPRVFTCSPLLDADPPIHRDIGKGVTNPEEVGRVLDDLIP